MELDETTLQRSDANSESASTLSILRQTNEPPLPEYYGLGRRLRRLRLTLGISQGEVASHVGVGRSQWAAYEEGTRRIPYEACIRLAGMTRVTTDWIYRGDAMSISHAVLSSIGSGIAIRRDPMQQNSIGLGNSQSLMRDKIVFEETNLLDVHHATDKILAPVDLESEGRSSSKSEDLCSASERAGMPVSGGCDDVR